MTAAGTLLLGSGWAVAAPPSDDACAVEVVLAGADSDVAAMRARVRELLDHDGMAVIARQVETIDPRAILATHGGIACAYIWIDLRHLDEAQMYLTSSDGERFVVRRVPLPGTLDELRRESIGQIVESSAAALIGGAPIGVPRDEAARMIDGAPAPPPAEGAARPAPLSVATPPAGSRAREAPGSATGDRGLPRNSRPPLAPSAYRVEVGYAVAAFGPGPAIEQGPVLGFALGWGRLGPRATLGVRGQYDAPVQVTTGRGVALLFQGASVQVGGGAEVPVGSRVRLGALGGAGIDVLWAQPEHASDPALALQPAVAPLTIGFARAALVIVGRLLPSVEVTASAFADVLLRRAHFDVREGDATTPDLTLWPIRPGLCLTLNFAPDPAP